ncbi:MAG: hypothetical protein Q8O09_00915 [Bacillota bacterium]|nr:hypothetical protein [Bacillota bacterium]
MIKRLLIVFLILPLAFTAGTAASASAAAASPAYPFVVPDKTRVLTGEAVNFKITTSVRVKKIQTVIDGVSGRTYTNFTTGTDVRNWQAKIYFTTGGKRKVQFKCTMLTGSTVLIPATPVIISVTFKYTATSTSKIISTGKTVTFTLKTPSSITSVYAVIDGVNQNKKFSKPYSDIGGIKVWKVPITFFKLGTRSVKFSACVGTSVKKTFPDTGIVIIVKDN